MNTLSHVILTFFVPSKNSLTSPEEGFSLEGSIPDEPEFPTFIFQADS